MFPDEKNVSDTANHVITLTNINETETFSYSLPIIKGYITSYVNLHETSTNIHKTITLRNLNTNENEITKWPVVNNNFKCLANLQFGDNHFALEFGDAILNLHLIFNHKDTKFHVLPVYIICEGDDGRFQSPDGANNSPESACKRIVLGSKLIQSLTAEKLYEAELGRRTFQLSGDMDQSMDCIVFNSKLNKEEVYGMESEEIWEHFGRELMSSPYGCDERKFLAFLSCTSYRFIDTNEPETHEEVMARAQGHVALGGGGLAIFGTGCLHTWPEEMHEIVDKFTDETKVDKTKFMDDSCYRGTYGACFSTTLGSVCHELGHTFDLGHSKKGIMGRGFDNMNLVFTVNNQSKDANRNIITRHDAQHATVCFTRDLNVTYVMSSPIKRPRGMALGMRTQAPKKSASESDVIKNWNTKVTWSSESQNDNDKKQMNTSKVPVDDLTFWEKNCAIMLKFHKWFADNDVPDNLNSSIEFDQSRKMISASSGIRVIELRGEDGIVLSSWEFLSTYAPKQFSLPVEELSVLTAKGVSSVVAQDSHGNIIKESLLTG